MAAIAGYEILDKLYESHSTVVYRAIRESDSQKVILKMLRDDFPLQRDIIRFKQEYEITREWDHPRLARSYDLIYVRNKPLIVLEDIGGESLAKLRLKYDWSVTELLAIASKIAEGLAAAHSRNIIHKDINPSNIVYDPASGNLKVIDFGISSAFKREDPLVRNPDALEGTLAYISPEQTGRMNRALDYRTDFYSFGVTLYELFTGTLPFSGDDALELVHQHLSQVPRPANEMQPALPQVLTDIIAKLMAKAAEDRYHTGWGIKADLDRCREALLSQGRVEPFALGRDDMPDQFRLPHRRYGRESAVAELNQAFSHVIQGGRELVLISGYSGIGKTSLVHELYKPATRRRAYLIGGKFDQFQRNTPYTALVGAFQELVRQLLTESEQQLIYWRERLIGALGANGQIIVDAIPEMGLIMGPQTPVPVLPPHEARNRFNVVFQRFIQVFCRPAHPLVIFLDDLQWADNATLGLLDALMMDEQTHHLLVILAYRDNEIAEDHALLSHVDRLAVHGTQVRPIHLAPLALPHLENFIADTLHCEQSHATALAQLVEAKTGGNPFFVAQFLTALYQQGLIWFGITAEDKRPCWRWDIAQIQGAGITDNVVDLLLANLAQLPNETQYVLQVAACIGNLFGLEALASACNTDIAQTYADLQPAMRAGLILPASSLELADPNKSDSAMVHWQLKFLHDRVQQAAYALISVDQRPAMHLSIGRLLLQSMSATTRQERVFELVDHLNVGRDLISDAAERMQLAQLNLDAAIKAKAAAAFSAALRYALEAFEVGGGDWEANYDLALHLHREAAELHYLNGDYAESERLIDVIWQRGRTAAHKAQAYGQLVTQRTMQGHYDDAIEAAARALRLFNIDFPAPDKVSEALSAELQEVDALLQGRPVMALLDLPDMGDADMVIVVKLLMTVHTTIFFTGRYQLYSWVLARMTALSIRFGNVPESSKGYASFGNSLAANLGRYETGYEYGILGLRLAERYRNQGLKCKASLILSMFLNHWSRPMREADVFDEEGQQAGLESGEFQFVGYILFYGRTLNRFYRGDYLGSIAADLKAHLRFAQKAKHSLSSDNLMAAVRVILPLLGDASPKRIGLDDIPDEREFLASCKANSSMAALAFYYTAESFRHYLARDFAAAATALDAARPMLRYVKGIIVEAAFVFYESLVLCASVENGQFDEPVQLQIRRNQQQLATWASHAPSNFQHQSLLVKAELARVEGREFDAMNDYDAAIESAQEAGFAHHEALANELAGRFWMARQKTEFAMCHLRRARLGYRAWGASFKENLLLAEFTQLSSNVGESPSSHVLDETMLIAPSKATYHTQSAHLVVNNLDLASVLKASQAISGEIELDRLLDRLLRVLLENAGAEYGGVLLQRGGKLVVAATISAEAGGVTHRSGLPVDVTNEVPRSIVQYVIRSTESVVLPDASDDPLFSSDPYIQKRRCRSLLCMPIRHGGELIGLLYLENNQMVGAFPPSRMGLLGILSSQAAISIQNAMLYTDLVVEVAQHKRAEAELRDAEAQYRAVFENAADGIFRANADGQLILANPALAKMLGFSSPASLIDYSAQPGVGRFLSMELRALLVQHFNRDGAIRNIEFRASRRDGGILELSITGYVGRDVNGTVLYYEGVIQDVTARKRVAELKIAKEAAEAAARAKGEFLANMSHEIRTPMTAILGFATLALKQDVPPRIKDYLQKIDNAGQSLLGVINDILDFSKMDAGRLELEAIPFDINDVLLRVHDLFAEQARAKGIGLLVSADRDLPNMLVGDPGRLSQILVNLVSNAIKFTRQGEVAVEVSVQERRDDEVQLNFEVRDTGIGMVQAQIDKLFQAFAQADTSTTRHYGGTGLGLTISKNLTELMGGAITVASEPGVGSIFVVAVAFPIATTTSAPQAFVSPAPAVGDVRVVGGGGRVLLVEDNAINQQVATELLTSAGYTVDVANNGVEAVYLVEASPYDVVLMDIQMPEMDGYEATQRIREGAHQPDVPIVAMTAHAIAGYREQCLARGMNDYITKPISPPDLFRTVARWCVQSVNDPMPAASTHSAASDSSAWDLRHFAELAPLIAVGDVWRHVGGKGALLYRLLERFVQSALDSDKALRTALHDGDVETAQRIIHTTKGMAGTLAAADLQRVSTELEIALERRDIPAAVALQQQYFEEGEKLRAHISAFLSLRNVH